MAIEHENGALVVRPRGDLDLATAPELEMVLQHLMGEHWAVVVDLSEVAFVDCAGLAPVRRALQGPHLVSLTARTAPPQVQRVLDLTGLGRRPEDTGARLGPGALRRSEGDEAEGLGERRSGPGGRFGETIGDEVEAHLAARSEHQAGGDDREGEDPPAAAGGRSS